MITPILIGIEVAERQWLNISHSQAFDLMRSNDISTIRFGDRCVCVRTEGTWKGLLIKSSTNITKNLPAVSAASKSEPVTPKSLGDRRE